MIEKLSSIDQERLIDGLFAKEQEVPTMDQITREEVAEQLAGEMTALKDWFIGSGQRPSEYENLMEQTNQMITKMTGLIYYFGQEFRQYQSRKKDYLHIAKWFAKAENLAEAQKMYAGIFGLEHGRNFYVSEGSVATSVRDSTWELEPGIIFLAKRGRGARMERKATAVKTDPEAQAQRQADYLKKINEKQARIEAYFTKGRLDFANAPVLDGDSRKVFLRWISGAVAQNPGTTKEPSGVISQTYRTELNYEVKITINPSHRITVACLDGDLQMPHVVMERVVSR